MASLDSMKVRDYMTVDLLTFSPGTEVMMAINQLVKHKVAGAPVIDADGQLIGMLSEKDCLSVAIVASHDTCIAGPVRQFMSTELRTVGPETDLMQLASMFVSHSYRRYPVVENGQLIGQISRSDVLRAIDSLC